MNSRRYTMTSLSIVFLAVAMISVSALSQNAYAASGLSISADGSGDTIAISGHSDRSDLDVTIVLSNSMGIHGVAQSSVSGGSYSASFNVSDLSDGAYTITATQSVSGQTTSKYSIPVDIDVSDGTSTSSVSVNNRTSYDEGTYVSSENIPTTESLKKLTLTADGIQGSTTINVSGTTDRSNEVIVKVLAPNGNIIAIAQITPTGGSFATTIGVGGPLWSQDGTYTITATQTSNGLNSSTETFNRAVDVTGGGLANYQNSAEVEILDGHVIPEFGVIAAMILAVAIVSIIVVTAKTRLSIVPRY